MFFVVLLALLSGCGKQVDRADQTVLGVIPKSSGGEYWGTVHDGAKRAADDLDLEIRWEGTVTETEIAEQNQIIENMITLGVDGIALAPLNSRAMRGQVRKAVDAGIPVVIFDSAVEGDAHSSFVATDNRRGGEMGAKHLVTLLEEGERRVMVMRYVQGAGSTEDRAAGFMEHAKANDLEILADPYPETGTIEGCKNAAANTLEGFVEDGTLQLDGLFACNLYSTLGALSALNDLRNGGVEVEGLRFIGFDTSRALLDALNEGTIDALVAQNPVRMGYLAVETLSKVVGGESVDEVIDTGVAVVTRENLKSDPDIRAMVGLE